MTKALEMRGVCLRRRGLPVLQSVDLDVPASGFLAILGPNGGGKTTLLKVALGLVAPDSGTVRVLGTTPRDARGRVGYVPQHFRFDLDFPVRVMDVALMGRLGRGRLFRPHDAADRRAAREALARVEMTEHSQRPIGTLSGGQVQRVLIARALALQPGLLLLDEPAASLDERIGRGLWDLLDQLSKSIAVVLVSHDIGAVSKHVDGVACLNRTLVSHASPELTQEMLDATYGRAVDVHSHAHEPEGPRK